MSRSHRRHVLIPSLSLLLAAQLAAPTWGGKPKEEKEAEGERKAFAEVVKGASVSTGLFSFHRKEENTYLELAPEQLERVYLLSPMIESGLGERGFYSGQTVEPLAIAFRRLGPNVQLVRKNVRYTAAEGDPMREVVERSYADSMLTWAPILSQPHPQRRSILVDASKLFVADITLLGWGLEYEYRWPYKLDADSSALTAVQNFPLNSELLVELNFTIDRPPVPPLPGAGNEPEPPPPPIAVPDPRGIPFRVRHSVSALPETGYRPRLADDRVGTWHTMREDFTDDRGETPYVRYIERWQLEPTDPALALSPVKQPIVFWLEKTVPEKYREALTAGALLWNQAFERIGLKDAVVVRQQPPDADWDPADVRYSTIRWFVGRDAAFADGWHRSSPLTGQTYDADIRFGDEFFRYLRSGFRDFVAPRASSVGRFDWGRRHSCDLGPGAAADAAFAFSLAKSRGLLADPQEEERFVRESLVEIAAHEVGHTLGLRHNFRASTLRSNVELSPAGAAPFTGSVMDYNPANISPAGVPQGAYFQTTLGPYDYWAIEYLYRPLPGATPADELPELRKIAARGAAKELAFGTDDDAGWWGTDVPLSIDPRVNRFDLGDDPLAFYAHQARLVHELWASLEEAEVDPGATFEQIRWSFEAGLSQLQLSLKNACRYVGGLYHNREHAGDAPGVLPYQPVPAAKQRQALEFLRDTLFAEAAFALSPGLLNRLAVDRFDNFENWDLWMGRQRLDFPLHQRILELERKIFDSLYHPVRLARLQDLDLRFASPAEAFTMAEMFSAIQDPVWSELKEPRAEIPSLRRALQREHLRQLIELQVRPQPGTVADATTLARHGLADLATRIERALRRAGVMSPTTRAHLEESAARIEQALEAGLERVL